MTAPLSKPTAPAAPIGWRLESLLALGAALLALLVEAVGYLPSGWLPFTSLYNYEQLPVLFLFAIPLVLPLLAFRWPHAMEIVALDAAQAAVLLAVLISYLTGSGFRLRPVNPAYLFLCTVVFYFLVRLVLTRFAARPGFAAGLAALWMGWFSAKAIFAWIEYSLKGTIEGQFTNQNYLGLFLALGIPVALVEALPRGGIRVRNFVYGAAFLLLVSVVVQTRCRTAAASLAIVLPLLALVLSFRPLSRIIRGWGWATAGALAVMAMGLAAWLAAQAYLLRPLSVSARILIWKVSLSMLAGHPFFGFGFNQFERNYPTFLDAYFQAGRALPVEASLAGPVTHAFNDYLQVLIDFGLVGSIPFFFLWGLTLWKAGSVLGTTLRDPLAARDPAARVRVAVTGALLTFMLCGLSYFPAELSPLAIVSCFALAWIVTDPPGSSGGRPRWAFRVSPPWIQGASLAIAALSGTFMLAGWQQNQATRTWQTANQLRDRGQAVQSLGLLESVREELSWQETYLHDYGRTLLAGGDLQGAIEWMERSRAIRSEPGLLEEMSSLYSSNGDRDRALQLARQAARIRPWRLTPIFLEGTFLARSGDFAAAAAAARQVLDRPLKRWTPQGGELKRRADDLLRDSLARLASFSPEEEELLHELSPEQRDPVRKALAAARENRSQLLEALLQSPPEQRESMAFLIANMRLSDLRSIEASLLLENVELAFLVRNGPSAETPIPEEIFRNYVLPYSLLAESPGRWRRDYLQRYLPLARQSKTTLETLIALNHDVYGDHGVAFDDRSTSAMPNPLETASRGKANCQGLSIMLAAAARAVGIPSRVVVIPRWVGYPSGHAWVEFWVDGAWHHGSAYDVFTAYDDTWFTARAAYTNENRFEHRIYAASYERNGIRLEAYGDTPFLDITAAYLAHRSRLAPPAR